MDNPSFEEHLNFFRSRTKVSGNSFQEKLKAFLIRLEKVASDSENSSEQSLYRNGFGRVHKLEFQNIQSYLEGNPQDLRNRLNQYLSYLTSHLREIYENLDIEDVGIIDGLSYIIVELDEVLK